jgi:5-methylcytosine-specific restriction enzyme A
VRTEFTRKVKAEAFLRSKGRCEKCTALLGPGNVEYDHDTPDQMGGEPSLANCVVLCRACHKAKTAKVDAPMIALAKRRHATNIGAKAPSRNPMPCGRRSKFKKRMDGTVVLR